MKKIINWLLTKWPHATISTIRIYTIMVIVFVIVFSICVFIHSCCVMDLIFNNVKNVEQSKFFISEMEPLE